MFLITIQNGTWTWMWTSTAPRGHALITFALLITWNWFTKITIKLPFGWWFNSNLVFIIHCSNDYEMRQKKTEEVINHANFLKFKFYKFIWNVDLIFWIEIGFFFLKIAKVKVKVKMKVKVKVPMITSNEKQETKSSDTNICDHDARE